jgi:hypothetical protein
MLAMLAWLRATLQQLAFQAAKNGNPELYAEVVLDNVPPGVNVAEFKSHLLRDDWWSVLTQFCPEVAPYKGWMTQFRQYTLEMIEEQAKTQDSNESPE